MQLPFIKMNGAGNDFVIFDARKNPILLTPEQVRKIAARDNVVTKGCDQVIVLETPPNPSADVFMRIYNADGGEVDACGNATRCVAWLIMNESAQFDVEVETEKGILECVINEEDNSIVVANMGKPGLEWQDIPLAKPMDTLHLQIGEGTLQDPVGVSMGNPHAVFFVPDAKAIDLATLGPKLEHHPLFPERANIGVVQILGKDAILLRVWERGAGETRSCGTGACAALVAANRRGLTGREVTIKTAGGMLGAKWLENDDVYFHGKVQKEFEGEVTL